MGQRFPPEPQFRIIVPGVEVLQPGPGVEAFPDEPPRLGRDGGEGGGTVQHLPIRPIRHLSRLGPGPVADQNDRAEGVVVQVADDAIGDAEVGVGNGNNDLVEIALQINRIMRALIVSQRILTAGDCRSRRFQRSRQLEKRYHFEPRLIID